jgi:hypothetical protein
MLKGYTKQQQAVRKLIVTLFHGCLWSKTANMNAPFLPAAKRGKNV